MMLCYIFRKRQSVGKVSIKVFSIWNHIWEHSIPSDHILTQFSLGILRFDKLNVMLISLSISLFLRMITHVNFVAIERNTFL